MTGETFATAAHRQLITKKLCSVRSVADTLNTSAESLYDRFYGRIAFTVEEARKLLNSVSTPDLADNLLEYSPFFAALRPEADEKIFDLQSGAAEMVYKAAEVLRVVQVALRDGEIDHIERREIAVSLVGVEKLLASHKETAKYNDHDP